MRNGRKMLAGLILAGLVVWGLSALNLAVRDFAAGQNARFAATMR